MPCDRPAKYHGIVIHHMSGDRFGELAASAHEERVHDTCEGRRKQTIVHKAEER